MYSIYNKLSFLISVKNKVRTFLHEREVDRAVFYGLLLNVWGMASAPVTALLIVLKFTPELQGYFYTFGSLLALQIFVELGLSIVIIQFASHEWSKLCIDKDGYIVGDRDAFSRLASLAKLTLKWYLVGSLIIIFVLGIGGYIFFSQSNSSNISWVSAWLMLSLLTGVTICLIPIWSLLEGCNQVSNVYAYRFWQGIILSLVTWVAILLGAELWVAPVSSAIALACAGIFLRYKYWNFLKALLLSRPTGMHIEWRKEILPMQWRLAVSTVSAYFIFSLFIPVLFKYHGPVIAGQFGMTWTLVNVIGAISTSWVAPKVPQFGVLIARREYKKLDDLFWRITKIIVSVSVLSAVGIWLFIYLLYKLDYSLANRLLPPLPAGILLAAQVIITVSVPFSSYLRAHKKEPLLFLSVMAGILTGLSTLIMGKYYSATGIAIGYLAVNLIIIPCIILTWHRCRILWHADIPDKSIINEM